MGPAFAMESEWKDSITFGGDMRSLILITAFLASAGANAANKYLSAPHIGCADGFIQTGSEDQFGRRTCERLESADRYLSAPFVGCAEGFIQTGTQDHFDRRTCERLSALSEYVGAPYSGCADGFVQTGSEDQFDRRTCVRLEQLGQNDKVLEVLVESVRKMDKSHCGYYGRWRDQLIIAFQRPSTSINRNETISQIEDRVKAEQTLIRDTLFELNNKSAQMCGMISPDSLSGFGVGTQGVITGIR